MVLVSLYRPSEESDFLSLFNFHPALLQAA